jgi:hypothetical protein
LFLDPDVPNLIRKARSGGEKLASATVSAMEARNERLPGEDLVERGVLDLERGIESVEALLVSIGSPRLRRLGVRVPEPFPSPEHRLYELLHREHSDAAHSRYNALVRRLVSFERAVGTVGSTGA